MTASGSVHVGDLAHWCVLPMLAGLAVSVVSARRAWRHRLGTFDPLLWLEGFTVYLVGVAPLLHVVLRRYIIASLVPVDFRPWMGAMALFNLAGLGLRYWLTTPVYDARVLHGDVAEGAAMAAAERRIAAIAPRRLRWMTTAAQRLTWLTGVGLALLVVAAGGPAGFVHETGLRDAGFRGLGWLTIIADLLPMAALLWWLASGARRQVSQRSLWVAGAAACSLQFAISGLRGSRIQLVYFGLIALAWLAWRGLVVSRRALACGVVAALLFSYCYTLYKDVGGAMFWKVVTFQEDKPRDANHRDIGTLLLGDLSRADIQAEVLWSVSTHPTNQPLAFGRTYVDDVLVHVPSVLRPQLDRWSKVQVGGDRLFGRMPDGVPLGYIYGLAGEGLLNFGLLAVLPLMGAHAWLVRTTMLWCDRRRRAGVAVQLLWPVLTILLITAWMSDLDQVIYMSLRFAVLPFAVVLGAWRKARPVKADARRQPSVVP